MRYQVEDLEYWADADWADADWADADWADADWADADWAGAGWADAEDLVEPGMASVLREALHEDYAGAEDEAYGDALEAVLDGMSAAEAFSFEKALRQIQTGASRALADPLVGQVVRTALPAGSGALGTLIGGPAGTAIGSRLGALAAGTLAGPGQPAKGPGAPPAGAGAPPAVAGGSSAAAQALVLTQQPDVLKALLALSMGRHGARQVDGVRVADVMSLLSSVLGQAAADADELAYLDGEAVDGGGFDGGGFDGEGANGGEPGEGGTGYAEPAVGTGRCLYTALMDIENEELAS